MLQKLNFLLPLAAGFFAAWALFAPVVDEHHDHDHDHEHDHDEERVVMNNQEMQENQIRTHKVDLGRIEPGIELRGKVQMHPDRVAHVLPKMAGVVKDVYKNRGDAVEAGERIALLESQEMAQAKAEFLQSIERLALLNAKAEREEALFQKNLSSKNVYESALNERTEALIAKDLAEQKLLAYGLSDEELEALPLNGREALRYYTLKAPINGSITERHLTQGEYVEATETVFEIADPTLLWVEMAVPANLQPVLKKGHAAFVQFPCSEEKHHAKIVYVTPFISEETISARAVAELKNDNVQHCPGQFVTVFIPLSPKINVLTVPKSAIQDMDGDAVVFVRDGEEFFKRKIGLGVEDGKNAEVLAGLNSGDEVVSQGAFLIKADLGKHTLEHED